MFRIRNDILVVMKKHTLNASAITYEKARGIDNLKAIVNNVNSFLGTEESKKEPAGKETSATSGKKFLLFFS